MKLFLHAFGLLTLMCIKCAVGKILIFNAGSHNNYPKTTTQLLEQYPDYRQLAEEFFKQESVLEKSKDTIYVWQREMAIVKYGDGIVKVIGSADVTACIIVILRYKNRENTAVALAHFDMYNDFKDAVSKMIKGIEDLTGGQGSGGQYELSMIGGVSDDQKVGEKIFNNVIAAFSKGKVSVKLVLAVVGELFTDADSKKPRTYGAAINVASGKIYPATFENKGPDASLRCAKLLVQDVGIKVPNIYDANSGLMNIGPFGYTVQDGDNDLVETDKELLKMYSGTPDIEPEEFVSQIRHALRYLRNYPSSKNVFKGNKPHTFERHEKTGEWVPSRTVEGRRWLSCV